MSAALDGVIDRLRAADCGPKRTGADWTARCPAHDDRNPSLSVSEGTDGRVLLHCFAGCSTDAVCSALGMKTVDLFNPATRQNGTGRTGAFDTPDEVVAFLTRKRGKPSAIWRYTDAKGGPVGLAVRFDDPREEGGKVVLPVSLQPGGWMVKAMPAPRPLYRLTELTEADRIIVCEGEKAADAARSLGLTATTSAGGCKAPAMADWSPLAGKDVVLIPDNDDAGRSFVERIAAMISVLGPKPTIRIVNLPDVPESGDIVEFIAARDGCIELARHDLDDLIKSTAPLTPVDATGLIETVAGRSLQGWTDPVAVRSALPAVEAFDPTLLPAVFMPWITDIAERMQCPPDFPAVSAMIAAAGVIGRRVGIRPKKLDDWLVVPNLWGVLIGRPSMMKTPPLKEVMRPVKALIKAADHEHEQAMREHRDRGQELDLRKAALESRIKSKLRKSDGADEEIAELLGITEDMAAELPQRKRYVVNDATVQALSEVMAENPNGVTLVRDELIGFLKSLDMESQQAARAFYLEAWDGTGSYESDRIGRGNTRVEAVCLSMVGTCQPGPLSEYLRQAITGGLGDDGLMQRFQLAVWPDDPGPWVNVDRFPDSDARNAAFAVFNRLDTLTADSIGAQRDELDLDGIAYLRFDDAAYERFIAWMTERENRLKNGSEAPAIESHMTKYRSLIPSIALVSHLADGGEGPVTLEALDRAIRWGDYLATHSRRIYAQGIEPELPAARALAQKILERKLASGFVVRDVYRPRWSRLATKEDATAAVECLIELDWLRREHVATGGAPKTIHEINPGVFAPDFEPFAPD